MSKHVFVSHSAKHLAVAESIVSALERRNPPCWIPARKRSPMLAIAAVLVMASAVAAHATRQLPLARQAEAPTVVASALPLAVSAAAAQSAPDAADLTNLLREFLAGASRNDAAVHDRFWADDLIYTSALGVRRGKAELMKSVRSDEPAKPEDGTTVYTAEEIRIQQYGDTAIVAFRLVATTDKAGAKEVANFFNTGTFLKRGGKWQAVAWQATRIPSETEQKK